MTDLSLYTKISSLPDSLKSEVLDFIDFLWTKKKKGKSNPKKGRMYGYAKDTITLKPDFDAPLDDFNDYM